MPIHSLFPLRLGGLAPFFQTFLTGLVVLSLSRLGLAIWHAEAVSAAQGWGQVFLSGMRVDVAVMSMWLGIPAALWLLLPASWSARGAVRAGFALWLAASLLVPFLLEVGTPPFMSEYGLRPNRLFIEYLVYPAEVGKTLLKGHLLSVLAATGSPGARCAAGWNAAACRRGAGRCAPHSPWRWFWRLRWACAPPWGNGR